MIFLTFLSIGVHELQEHLERIKKVDKWEQRKAVEKAAVRRKQQRLTGKTERRRVATEAKRRDRRKATEAELAEKDRKTDRCLRESRLAIRAAWAKESARKAKEEFIARNAEMIKWIPFERYVSLKAVEDEYDRLIDKYTNAKMAFRRARDKLVTTKAKRLCEHRAVEDGSAIEEMRRASALRQSEKAKEAVRKAVEARHVTRREKEEYLTKKFDILFASGEAKRTVAEEMAAAVAAVRCEVAAYEEAEELRRRDAAAVVETRKTDDELDRISTEEKMAAHKVKDEFLAKQTDRLAISGRDKAHSNAAEKRTGEKSNEVNTETSKARSTSATRTKSTKTSAFGGMKKGFML